MSKEYKPPAVLFAGVGGIGTRVSSLSARSAPASPFVPPPLSWIDAPELGASSCPDAPFPKTSKAAAVTAANPAALPQLPNARPSDFCWFDIPASSRVFDLHRPAATADLRRDGVGVRRRWAAGNGAASRLFPSSSCDNFWRGITPGGWPISRRREAPKPATPLSSSSTLMPLQIPWPGL